MRAGSLRSGRVPSHRLRGCRLLGTPSEDVWPGVSRLRDWRATLATRERHAASASGGF